MCTANCAFAVNVAACSAFILWIRDFYSYYSLHCTNKKKRMFSLWKICKRKAKCQHLSRIWTQGPCLKPPLFWPLTCNHWTIEVCAIIFVLHCSWHIPALLWRNMLHLSMSMRELQLRLAACLPYKSTGGHSHVIVMWHSVYKNLLSWKQSLGHRFLVYSSLHGPGQIYEWRII